MSDDLISRKAVIDKAIMIPIARIVTEDKVLWRKAVFVEDIEKLPSVQPERKKGEWIYGEHDIAMCDGYWCDQCGFFVPWDYKHKFIDFIKDYHWCPSCGADMRGDDHG